jgi:hypothetical protein
MQNQLDLSGADDRDRDYDAYGPSASLTRPATARPADYTSSG